MISYETASAVMQSTPILVAMITAFSIPLILYFLVGCFVRARSSDGRKLSSRMIGSANFWWAILIFGLLSAGLFLLVIFPVWLRLF
jgi:hypothetical protein